MRRVVFVVLALGVISRCAQGAEPIGHGIIGATEREVAAKLGAPDEKATASYLEWATEPRAPVVKLLVYDLKNAADIAIGFDAKGIARMAQTPSRGTSAGVAEQLCNIVAPGWTPEKDMPKVFPPIGHASIIYQGHRIPGIKIWEISSRGKNEIFPFFSPGGVSQWGVFKHVASCKGGVAYAVADVRAETGRSPTFAGFFIADTDTFWQWTFDSYFKLFKEGWPKRDLKFPEGSNVAFGPETWDAHFFMRGDSSPIDPRLVATRLLSPAVIELVKNPVADLAPARLAVQLLNERYDQTVTPQLVKLMQSESKVVRDRAASLVMHMDDPILISPLIEGLAGKKPIEKALEILQKTTAQDFGPDPVMWKQWLKDNQKALKAGYDERKSARAGDQAKVTVAFNGKKYHANPGETHAPICSSLVRLYPAETRIVWLSEARRRNLAPCTICNPVR